MLFEECRHLAIKRVGKLGDVQAQEVRRHNVVGDQELCEGGMRKIEDCGVLFGQEISNVLFFEYRAYQQSAPETSERNIRNLKLLNDIQRNIIARKRPRFLDSP